MNFILAGGWRICLWKTKGEYLFEALVLPASGCHSSVTIKLTEEEKVNSCVRILRNDLVWRRKWEYGQAPKRTRPLDFGLHLDSSLQALVEWIDKCASMILNVTSEGLDIC